MQIYLEILQQKCTTKESTLLTMGTTPLKKKERQNTNKNTSHINILNEFFLYPNDQL